MTHHDLNLIRVNGSGGSKGNGESDPNTLRSKARAKMLEVISEGVIEGFVDEAGNLLTGDDILKSIYFDQTPIRNADGSENFKGVLHQEHRGFPDEGYFNGFNAVETQVSVETQVKKSLGPVLRTIVDANADALRVILRIPALALNDTKNGGLKKTSLSYAIDVRAYNGSWVEVLAKNLNKQKTTSPFQIAHRIALPLNGGPWDVRVRRVTDDSDDDNLRNDLFWESYVILVEGKFTHPHSAKVGMEVNAEDLGSSIPPRSYRIRGIKVQVPTNYNPITRAYTGIWDGTFKLAWTNNPAWVFYDLLTNDRYGVGEFVRPEIVDKWSLYTVAQYCDQPIKSGYKNGDTGEDIWEPRFTFNGVIDSRDDAFFVLQSISTAWRGMAYWAVGQVFATADMPSDPVRIVAPANVLGGEFTYSGTALKARHSVIAVRWNDPDNFFRPATELVINNEMLQRYGWREKRLQLTGCTSRGLAHRYGKWVLDTEQHETETVTYEASWDHVEVRPGNLVAIADPRKAAVRLGGRVADHTGNVVTLDHTFTRVPGADYELMLTLPDGTLERRPILSFLKDDVVQVAPFSQQAQPDAMFAITGDVEPRLYRVLTVEETAPNIFKVTGLFHDPLKYARIEQGVVFEPKTYTRLVKTAPPTGLAVQEQGYVSQGQTYHSLHLSWTPPADFLNRGFAVSVDLPDDGGFITLGTTLAPWFEMQNVGAGHHVFQIRTIGFDGTISEPATVEVDVVGPDLIPAPTVTNLRLVADPASSQFDDADLAFAWDNNFALATGGDDAIPQHVPSPHYTFNTVKVYNAVTSQLLRSESVLGEQFVYSLAMNAADSTALGLTHPSRSLRIEVTVHDVYERESAVAVRTFTNPAPTLLNPVFQASGSAINFSYTSIADNDFAGVKIWMSETSGAIDPLIDEPVLFGKNNPMTIFAGQKTTYFFKVAAYDVFSNEATVSTEMSVTTGATVDVDPPAQPTGLTLSTRVDTVGGQAARMLLIAQVGTAPDEDFAYYDYEIRQDGGNWVAFASASNYFEWQVSPETGYDVRVRAIDRAGNQSVRTLISEITTPFAADLATQVNTGATAIDPGKILISGTTTLADWRRGGDTTKIDGGAISANTIEANKLTIGNRGVNLEGVEFEHNKPSANKVSWTAGSISYVDDAGVPQVVSTTAANATWTGTTLYIYWQKGATSISATSVFATAMAANNIILAVYRGDKDLNANYGRTVVDGGSIKTGTITAASLGVSQLSALSADLGDVTAGQVRTPDNKFLIDLNNKRIRIIK